jgi:hypothetical protein
MMSDSKKEADMLPEIVLENTLEKDQEDPPLKKVYEILDIKVDKILEKISRRELKQKIS